MVRSNILVLIDGAHAAGALDLNLTRLNASFFVANCHKWLACPKGCGFLWVRRDLQVKIAPMHPSLNPTLVANSPV